MASFNISINDQDISAESGQTVLEAATAAGIEIPTLCHHPALKPIGACRVCLVEVKGQRSLQPACTFPVAPRMVVQTESPKVVETRKFVLKLIFSERNHFCMFCEMSGDCELQKLGYRYGLDHWVYPTYTQNFPVDASPNDFLLDHNRCVLCRRCVRACADLAANHTLDMRQRGALTMVTADMNDSLAQSSCIACGICLDVCPTGALVDKRSAFAGRQSDSVHIKSVCSQCSLGCGIDMVIRTNDILRIHGSWDDSVTGGRLCKKGRFQSLSDHRSRILTPLKRLNGELYPADWKDALQLAIEAIGTVAAEHFGVLTTTGATNEALYLLQEVFGRQLNVQHMDLFNDIAPAPPSSATASLADLAKSDCILVTGTDPAETHPVAGMLIRQAVDRGARLFLIEEGASELALIADGSFKTEESQLALRAARQARYPVIVYGETVSKKVFTSFQSLKKAAFVALQPGVNTQAAISLGLKRKIAFADLEVLYVLAGEQNEKLDQVAAKIPAATFVVAQACYVSALTERANVVLPMATWPERSGSLTNTAGHIQKVNAVRSPRGESKADWEILHLLAEKLGAQPQVSIDGMASFTEPTFWGKENPSWQR
jgi:formate dehydrogenase major subunit